MITVTVRPKVRTYAPDSFPPQVFQFTDGDLRTAELFAERAEESGYAITFVFGGPDHGGPEFEGHGDGVRELRRSSVYASSGDRIVSAGRVLTRAGAE